MNNNYFPSVQKDCCPYELLTTRAIECFAELSSDDEKISFAIKRLKEYPRTFCGLVRILEWAREHYPRKYILHDRTTYGLKHFIRATLKDKYGGDGYVTDLMFQAALKMAGYKLIKTKTGTMRTNISKKALDLIWQRETFELSSCCA